MAFRSDLNDAAQQKWVLGNALERRHEERAQVHTTQCGVVVLGNIQEYSEMRKRAGICTAVACFGKIKTLLMGVIEEPEMWFCLKR